MCEADAAPDNAGLRDRLKQSIGRYTPVRDSNAVSRRVDELNRECERRAQHIAALDRQIEGQRASKDDRIVQLKAELREAMVAAARRNRLPETDLPAAP